MNACLFMCLSCHTLKKVPITSNATLVTYQRWKTLMEQTPQPSNSMLLWLTNQIKPPIAAMLEILMVGGNYQMINTLRVVFLACLLLRRLHAEMSSLIRGREWHSSRWGKQKSPWHRLKRRPWYPRSKEWTRFHIQLQILLCNSERTTGNDEANKGLYICTPK